MGIFTGQVQLIGVVGDVFVCILLKIGGGGYLDSQSVARQLGSLKFPVRNGSGNAASPGGHLRTGPDEQKKIQSA
jgi:hypothetical protein